MIGDRKKRFKEEMRIVEDKVPLSRLRKGLIKLFWAELAMMNRVTWCFSGPSIFLIFLSINPPEVRPEVDIKVSACVKAI